MLLLFSDPVVGEKYPWILSGPFPLNKLLLLITDIVEMLLEPGKVLWSVLLRITILYTFYTWKYFERLLHTACWGYFNTKIISYVWSRLLRANTVKCYCQREEVTKFQFDLKISIFWRYCRNKGKQLGYNKSSHLGNFKLCQLETVNLLKLILNLERVWNER